MIEVANRPLTTVNRPQLKSKTSRPQLANSVFEDFQTVIDETLKNHPEQKGMPESQRKPFWMNVYNAYLQRTLNYRTVEKDMKKYFSPTMQEAIYGMTVAYLCSPYMPVSDFSMLKGLGKITNTVRLFTVGIKVRVQYKGSIVIENADFEREHSPFYKSMKYFTQYIIELLKLEGIVITQTKSYKDWESLNGSLATRPPSPVPNKKSVRSLKSKPSRSTGKDAGSRPAGRSSVNYRPQTTEDSPKKAAKKSIKLLLNDEDETNRPATKRLATEGLIKTGTGQYRFQATTQTLGDNHTTRQMHKRKVQRWLDKLYKMKANERTALLKALMEHFEL